MVPSRDTVRRVLVCAAALAGIAVAGLSGAAPGRAAQEDAAGTPAAALMPATVYVDGRGAVTVPPDSASINIGVDVVRPALDEAQAEATRQATAVIEAARAAGVAEEDVQTVNYSVNIIRDYDDNGNPGPITGYQVSNQVNVTIRGVDRDADRVSTVLDAVVAAGANNIYGISFFIEDPTAAASQARVAAVRDARRKAEELAAAAGLSVGRVVSISEGFSPPPPPEVFAGGAADMAEARQSVPIEAGTSEVVVTVQMVFELR